MTTEVFLINLSSAMNYLIDQDRKIKSDQDEKAQQVERFSAAFKKEIDRINSEGWEIKLVVPFEMTLWSSAYRSPFITTSYFVHCTRNSNTRLAITLL